MGRGGVHFAADERSPQFMDIGDPIREIIVEPIENPVQPLQPSEPTEAPAVTPRPEEIPA